MTDGISCRELYSDQTNCFHKCLFFFLTVKRISATSSEVHIYIWPEKPFSHCSALSSWSDRSPVSISAHCQACLCSTPVLVRELCVLGESLEFGCLQFIPIFTFTSKKRSVILDVSYFRPRSCQVLPVAVMITCPTIPRDLGDLVETSLHEMKANISKCIVCNYSVALSSHHKLYKGM